MGAFCAWLRPDRPKMQWPDTLAARCTLHALTLGGLGLVGLQLVETNSFGYPTSGAPRFTTGARLLPGSGVDVPWARRSLELLAQRCDILKARSVSTTEWLDAVLPFGPMPSPEPTPPGARADLAAFPSDPKVLQLARMIHLVVAVYQAP